MKGRSILAKELHALKNPLQNFKDDKLRIVFEMCDSNKDGRVDKAELQEMLTSLIRFATATYLSKIYYPNSHYYLDHTTVEIKCIPNYVIGSIESTALHRVCYLQNHAQRSKWLFLR